MFSKSASRVAERLVQRCSNWSSRSLTCSDCSCRTQWPAQNGSRACGGRRSAARGSTRKARPVRASLIRQRSSLIARFNSLLGRNKLPVPMPRELPLVPLLNSEPKLYSEALPNNLPPNFPSSNAAVMRDLPIPGSPESSTTWPSPGQQAAFEAQSLPRCLVARYFPRPNATSPLALPPARFFQV